MRRIATLALCAALSLALTACAQPAQSPATPGTSQAPPAAPGAMRVETVASGLTLIRLSQDGNRTVPEERLLGDLGKRLRHGRVGSDGNVSVVSDEPDGQWLRLSPPAPPR